MAKPGETMSGSVILDIIEQARRSGDLQASVAKRGLGEELDVQSIISPGPGVADEAPRSKHHRGRSKRKR